MLTKWSALPLIDAWALWIELAVLVVFLIVFVGDFLLKNEEKRGLGAFTALGLGLILVTTFFKPAQGLALYGVYLSDGLSMMMKQVLLTAGIVGALASIEPVDEHMKGRQGEFFLMFLASLLGMLLLTGTRDLLLLVVALELVCLPGVVILALRDDPSQDRLVSHFSSPTSSALYWLFTGSRFFGVYQAVPISMHSPRLKCHHSSLSAVSFWWLGSPSRSASCPSIHGLLTSFSPSNRSVSSICR